MSPELDLEALQGPIARVLTAPGTDLSTISAKRVRKALLGDQQYAYLGLTPEVLRAHREDVDQAIARIFEEVSSRAEAGGAVGGSKRKRETHGDEGEGEDEGDGEDEDAVGGSGDGEEGEEAGGVDGRQASADGEAVAVAKSPAKKNKHKKSKKSVEESDAALARKLSSEINSRSRRGASSATSAPIPRKAKRKSKKSAETVNSEEDEGDTKSKKRGSAKGGFAKEYVLSGPLSAVLAIERLSRPQVVKKLWEYIRQHELQNPSNKKEIICDDALRAVFAVDKIDMFRMNKVLGQHLHEE